MRTCLRALRATQRTRGAVSPVRHLPLLVCLGGGTIELSHNGITKITERTFIFKEQRSSSRLGSVVSHTVLVPTPQSRPARPPSHQLGHCPSGTSCMRTYTHVGLRAPSSEHSQGTASRQAAIGAPLAQRLHLPLGKPGRRAVTRLCSWRPHSHERLPRPPDRQAQGQIQAPGSCLARHAPLCSVAESGGNGAGTGWLSPAVSPPPGPPCWTPLN